MSLPDASGDDPDVEVGASVRARKMRFLKKPRADAELTGRSRVDTGEEIEEIELETDSGSERRNLPEEVEPGVTYRDVEVGWRAVARARRRR
jgi:hypothetical protein